MTKLRRRIDQEMSCAAMTGRTVNAHELSERLAAEFAAECGHSDVHAAVLAAMNRAKRYRPLHQRLAQRVKDRWIGPSLAGKVLTRIKPVR